MTAVISMVRERRLARVVLIALAGVLIMAIAGNLTRTVELTARGTAGAALRLAIPIMMAGLGAIYSERSGVVNIGLEGMMIAGTWFGAWGAWEFGPWWGVLLGILGGALFGLIHAVATVTFQVDHIVSGVAINILALGGMRFLSSIVYTPETGGSVVQSPPVPSMDRISFPFVAGGEILGWKSPDFFGWLEGRRWFFLSDLGGLLRGITGDLPWLVIIGFALIPISLWVLWKTPWGLRLRSCGEHPHAADSLGVPVYRMKYYGVVISGAFAGLGGAFLPLVQGGIYREGQTGGRGFIGLAAMIFGNWRPTGVMSGALLFGFGDSLRFRGPTTLRALFLAVAIGLFLLALWLVRRRKGRQAIVLALIGGLSLYAHATLSEVPSQLLNATPYLITLTVLALATQRLRMPAADGMRYRKGEMG